MSRHINGGNSRALSLLDPYTTRKLNVLLENGDPTALRLKELLAAESRQSKQRSNTISSILHYTYHQPEQLLEAYPLWLSKFVFAKTEHKKDRLRFVQEFGSMLTFSHTIFQVIGKNDSENPLLKSYLANWKTRQLDFAKTIQFVDPDVILEIASEDLLQLKFRPEKFVSPDIKKLIRVRQQYSSVMKHKFKSLELTIPIEPNRFGLPPSPERTFNMRVNRLAKLQKHYRKYPPITQQDMKELNQLDLLSMSGAVREAYVNFLSTEVFTIDDDARLAKSNILEKRVAISEKMKTLYKEFR